MRRLGKRLAAAAAGVALALAAGEVALRVAGFSSPHLYRPHPVRGWELAPGASGLWTEEGRAWVEVNPAGFRDVPRQRAKPAGVFRIAVLGDSQTEALQVEREERFTAVLEDELAGCRAAPPGWSGADRPRFEVLNFGVAGYGTAQELLTLRDEALAYDPDLVLLAVYTGNDVRNNLEALELDPARPYFVLPVDETGPGSAPGPAPSVDVGAPPSVVTDAPPSVVADARNLELDDSFRDSRAYRLRTAPGAVLAYALLRRSRLAQLAKRGVSAAKEREAAAAAEERAEKADEEALAELGLDNAVYSPPATPEWREAWRVTEALVLRMAEEARAAGTGFALVTLSNGIQVHPEREVRRDFAARLGLERFGVRDLLYPDRRLARLAERHGIPHFLLAGPLRRLAERRSLYLHGFERPAADGGAAPDVARWNQGHWNSEGHRAAGELLVTWLCRRWRREGAAQGAEASSATIRSPISAASRSLPARLRWQQVSWYIGASTPAKIPVRSWKATPLRTSSRPAARRWGYPSTTGSRYGWSSTKARARSSDPIGFEPGTYWLGCRKWT